MENIKFIDNHIELEKIPKKLKKLTATRFANVMGLNKWSTPFQAWSEITKTYEPPFEDSIYTIAGKAIEPKICEYLRKRYFMDIKSPEDVYGKDYFSKTFGDFFPEVNVLGGMWDFLGEDFIVEVKTTKRVEDWEEDIPIYYKLQASLYAYLKGFDDVVVPVAFLDDKTYEEAQYVLDNFSKEDREKMYKDGEIDKYITFVPMVENTKIYEFKLSEAFPNFEEDYVNKALEWWDAHVLTGISPDYDEKADAEYLKELRKNTVEVISDNIEALLNEADELKEEIEKVEATIVDKAKRLKEVEDNIKKYMGDQFRDGEKKVELSSSKYVFTLSRTTRKSVDTDKLKEAGLYNAYLKESESLTLKSVRKEG